jgi:hypothetical protein
MKSNKYMLSLFLLFSGLCITANQVKLPCVQYNQIKRTRMENDELMSFDEELDFDFDEQEINVAQLVPVWAKLANKLAAPFFVLYNKMSHWWEERIKKNDNIKRF